MNKDWTWSYGGTQAWVTEKACTCHACAMDNNFKTKGEPYPAQSYAAWKALYTGQPEPASAPPALPKPGDVVERVRDYEASEQVNQLWDADEIGTFYEVREHVSALGRIRIANLVTGATRLVRRELFDPIHPNPMFVTLEG